MHDNVVTFQQQDQTEPESLARLKRLRAERMRLRGLVERQKDRQAEREHLIRHTNQERLELLTDYEVNRESDAKKRSDELLQEELRLERELADSRGIVTNITRRLDTLEREMKWAEQAYRGDLGRALDSRMLSLGEHYKELVPDFCAAIVDVAALQRVMEKLGCGNSNSFWGQCHVPRIEAGDGNLYPPYIAADTREFDRAVAERADSMMAELHSGGLIVL